MFHHAFNFTEFSKNSIEILNTYQSILNTLLNKTDIYKQHHNILNANKFVNAIIKIFTNLYMNPSHFMNFQKNYIEKSLELITHSLEKVQGKEVLPLYAPSYKDKRFDDESWSNNIYFDFIKQFYLMNQEWFIEIIHNDKTIDKQTRAQALFFITQFFDAISPSNFVYTNPVVLHETIATNGKNILKGMEHLLHDIKNSNKLFDISRIHNYQFKIGETIAVTPGEVIYKNDLMELICYTPSKKTNFAIPLLIIPPWINKYYILDLSPDNSLVKFLVDNGITVFLVSWVNPGTKHKNKSFDDYLCEGSLAAISAIQDNFNVPKLNILGYCIGGTLVSILLSYLHYHKKENVINTASMLTTLIDFKDGGELSVFIDEKQLEYMQKQLASSGFYEGDVMNMFFSILRANDMVWSFAVNNYLLGKKPLPFDILYWNSDSTRLTSKVHDYYLKNMYLENNLIKPNKLNICNTPIDISSIKTPCYFISTYDDHIVPWKGTYNAFKYLNCPINFILAGSGHVVGIINPPHKNKYCYWKSEKIFSNSRTWINNAIKFNGSWWLEWLSYLNDNSGAEIDSSHIGKIAKKLSIDKAPGKYVLKR